MEGGLLNTFTRLIISKTNAILIIHNYTKGVIYLSEIYPKYNYILLKKESKAPAVHWQPFQDKRFPYESFIGVHDGNWAIVCGTTSGIMVIDVDSTEALRHLKELGFDLLNYDTPIVKTGRGFHFYFKYDAGFSMNNKVGVLKNVDFKTQGGYVLAPPSVHPERKTPYKWLKSPFDYDAMDMPSDLKTLLSGGESKAETKSSKSGDTLNLTQFIGKSKGERDVSLTRAAGYLYGHPYNMDYKSGLDLLHVINNSFSPPLPDKDVVKVAQSIFNKDKQRKEKPQFTTKKGNPIMENIVWYLAKNLKYIVTKNTAQGRNSNANLLIYNDKLGYYTADAMSFLGYWLYKHVGEKAASKQHYINDLFTGLVNAVPPYKRFDLEKIQTHEQGRINCHNGVVDLETLELQPHSAKYLFLGKLPVEYDPEADCPVWKEFLNTTLEDKHIPTLQEFIGYCLIPDTRFQKALMLYGTGANGKSIVINTINALFGREYTSHVSLSTLQSNRFAAYELIGKLVNTSSETANYTGKELDMFKAIVSGDDVFVESKGVAGSSTKLFARLIFASNTLLRSGDKSDGNYRRWIIIPFTKQFKGEDADLFLQDKINKELPGILNWAIEGLKRLYKQGKFSYVDMDMVEAMLAENDTVVAHAIGCLKVTGNDKDRETLQNVYNNYIWYNVEERNKEKKYLAGKNNYVKRLMELYPEIKKVRQSEGMVLKGVKIFNKTELL